MNLEQALATAYVVEHAEEAALLVQNIDETTATAILSALDPEAAEEVFRQLTPFRAARIVEQMSTEGAAALLERVQIDWAAVVLYRVHADVCTALLDMLPRSMATALRRVLAFPPDTAGGLADPSVLTLGERETVADTLARVRREVARAAYYLYVVGNDGRPTGVLTLRELIAAEPQATIASVCHRDPETLPAETPAAFIRHHPGWGLYHAMPVVDHAGRFVGMLRHETLRDVEQTTQRAGDVSPAATALAELFGIGAVAGLSWAGGLWTTPNHKETSP